MRKGRFNPVNVTDFYSHIGKEKKKTKKKNKQSRRPIFFCQRTRTTGCAPRPPRGPSRKREEKKMIRSGHDGSSSSSLYDHLTYLVRRLPKTILAAVHALESPRKLRFTRSKRHNDSLSLISRMNNETRRTTTVTAISANSSEASISYASFTFLKGVLRENFDNTQF